MSEERCICCGEIIPEGKQICPNCEMRKENKPMEKNFDLLETSKILGVKVRTIREWVKSGFIVAKKYDGKHKWYISETEIERIQKNMK